MPTSGAFRASSAGAVIWLPTAGRRRLSERSVRVGYGVGDGRGSDHGRNGLARGRTGTALLQRLCDPRILRHHRLVLPPPASPHPLATQLAGKSGCRIVRDVRRRNWAEGRLEAQQMSPLVRAPRASKWPPPGRRLVGKYAAVSPFEVSDSAGAASRLGTRARWVLDPFDTSRLCAQLAASERPQRRWRAADTAKPTVKAVVSQAQLESRRHPPSSNALCDGVSTWHRRRRHTRSGARRRSPSMCACGGYPSPHAPQLYPLVARDSPGRWRRPARARDVSALCDGGECAARIPRTRCRATACRRRLLAS